MFLRRKILESLSIAIAYEKDGTWEIRSIDGKTKMHWQGQTMSDLLKELSQEGWQLASVITLEHNVNNDEEGQSLSLVRKDFLFARPFKKANSREGLAAKWFGKEGKA